ncbi:TadE/TadG family type IV pilus assembly protein [Micromonospora sp. NPDC050397]|uniref:TadE/TadG family type IV pilus assembly protein n=1 Tax=Micromonospora sp. NPDC050397 TaxID=3364279 RepID=UPI003850F229
MRQLAARIRFRATAARNRIMPEARDRGATPLELAIVMPAILVLLMLSIQAAAWFLARTTALNAAQEAVSAQRAYQAGPGVGAQRANEFLAKAGGWLIGAQVTVTPVGGATTEVSATVQGQAVQVVPFVTLPTISETAHGTVERLTPVTP